MIDILFMWVLFILFYSIVNPPKPERRKYNPFEDGFVDKPEEDKVIHTPDPIFRLGHMFMPAQEKKAHLNSTKWKTLRKARVDLAQNSCEKCGITNVQLNAHHLHYQTLGDEDIDDIRMLCTSCHTYIHDKLGYDRTTEYPIT